MDGRPFGEGLFQSALGVISIARIGLSKKMNSPTKEHPMDSKQIVAEAETTAQDVIEVDTLVEEVSIDGMCGVY